MTMVVLPAAILTIIVLNILLAPLMHGSPRQKIAGWALLVVVTLAAMGLYLAQGSPGIPSAPAVFEKQGPRHEKREAVKKELELSRALQAAPDDTALMLKLGTVRLQNGRMDEAIAVLTRAHAIAPDDKGINTKLGAAHYAAALAAFLLDDDRQAAQAHFDKALEIAPQDAPYRGKLATDLKKFHEET